MFRGLLFLMSHARRPGELKITKFGAFIAAQKTYFEGSRVYLNLSLRRFVYDIKQEAFKGIGTTDAKS